MTTESSSRLDPFEPMRSRYFHSDSVLRMDSASDDFCRLSFPRTRSARRWDAVMNQGSLPGGLTGFVSEWVMLMMGKYSEKVGRICDETY
jgi:hypothetical protein